MGGIQVPIEAASVTIGPKLTPRRQLLLQGISEGKSVAAASAHAGISRQAGHEYLESLRDRLPEFLAAAQITPQAILERLRDQMDATKTVTAASFGQITDSIEVADNQARGKAIELGLKLTRLIDSDTGVRIGHVNIMWASVPGWAQPVQAPVPVTEPLSCSAVQCDNESVTAGERVPISTLEGTGRGPGGRGGTNSANSASAAVISQPDEVAGTLLHRMQQRKGKRKRGGK